jgi:hypothetical protein
MPKDHVAGGGGVDISISTSSSMIGSNRDGEPPTHRSAETAEVNNLSRAVNAESTCGAQIGGDGGGSGR